jgi:crossover junction endodeoxyribonuclease RuvC
MTVKIKNSAALSFPMKVMGLDVSTKTGAVLLDSKGKVLLAKEIDLPAMKGNGSAARIDRVVALYGAVFRLLSDHRAGLVMIEGYGYANAHTLALLVELGALVRYACVQVQVPFVEVAPGMLKKYIAGSGAAKKDLMRLAVYKKWGFEHPSDNVVDAYALAQLGRVYSGAVSPAHAYERDALKKLKAASLK